MSDQLALDRPIHNPRGMLPCKALASPSGAIALQCFIEEFDELPNLQLVNDLLLQNDMRQTNTALHVKQFWDRNGQAAAILPSSQTQAGEIPDIHS